MPRHSEAPRIYNLFPLLAGSMPRWKEHLERARAMGFNCVFVNPFHLPGLSGSIYAVKDYYRFNPLLVDEAAGPAEEQLRQVLRQAHALGLSMIMDLVINHTAVDSPLLSQHPNWYKRDAQGEVLHPGAMENGRWVTWEDLATIDNENSPDRDALWNYWLELIRHYIALGFAGFRCDAAYLVPADLWRFLIGSTRRELPQVQFLAETLGCTPEQTLAVAATGFDYIFNSSKWWDYTEPWCLEQQKLLSPRIASISFPESHDTPRLAAELNGNRQAVRQRYVFAALFASGVMAPMGFEFGFRDRLSVSETRPQDWSRQREHAPWDDSTFIRSINLQKAAWRVWNEDGSLELLDAGNPAVLALQKATRNQSERAVLLINKDPEQAQSYRLPEEARRGTLVLSAGEENGRLPRAGYHVFVEQLFTE